MSGANYWYCEICNQKALYDEGDEVRQDIVVMHTSCIWQDRKERAEGLRLEISSQIEVEALKCVGDDGPDLVSRSAYSHAAKIASGVTS